MNALGSRWLVAGVLVALAGACSLFGKDTGGGDTIRFTHKRHIAAKIDCLSCHEEVDEAEALGKRHLPLEDKCMECHAKVKERGECKMCHSNAEKAGPWQPRAFTLIVDHKKHMERTEEKCERCHKSLPEIGDPGPRAPPMDACTDCHEHRAMFDQGRCEVCHVSLARYPLKPVAEFSHAGYWLKRHGAEARAAGAACATCHDQGFCTECHAKTVDQRIETKLPERVDREFVHRGDWVSRHDIEGKADRAACLRCHGVGYCQECHEKNNLVPESPNPRDPHPLGWAFPGENTPHGVAARRDIGSCAACHDQGPRSICVDCHRTGGVGGNPHPVGWTTKHPASEIRSNGMCLICHT